MKIALAVSAGLVLSLATACGERAPARRHDALVICIDALRADHLGAYGYPRQTSPAIDRLTRSAVVFEAASSPGSWTKPSVPSYFTGRFPHQHGVYQGTFKLERGVASDVLREEERTLAELFQDAGYQTVAIVNNPQLGRRYGFAQGFGEYQEGAGDAAEIAKRFLAWLDHADPATPFFAYLHFLDVHLPYDPPAPWRTAFGDGASRVDFGRRPFQPLKQRLRSGELSLGPDERRALFDLYDAEILYTDAKLGEIFSGLERTGRLDTTLIALLADHGEELLDRGGIDHGTSLYEELLHVPLILRFPAGDPGALRIAAPASTVDLLPTFAEYFGLERPPGISGRSLLGVIGGAPEPVRPIYAEGVHGPRYQHSVRLGEWKYVASVPVRRKEGATGSALAVGDPWYEALERGVAPQEELYHLATDPGERNDLSQSRPHDLARMRSALRDARPKRSAPPTEARAIDPADAEALRELGYLE